MFATITSLPRGFDLVTLRWVKKLLQKKNFHSLCYWFRTEGFLLNAGKGGVLNMAYVKDKNS